MSDPTAPDSKAQAALDRALDQQDLLLVYQPIHDLATGRIVAAEALMRQRRQSGEIREAGIITAAAEEGPDLFVLDSMLIGTAYRDAAAWQSSVAPDVRLNVNLSPREFQEGNVIERLTRLLGGCGIDSKKVNLEITETSYIEEPEETMHVLNALTQTGIHLWLDDFGTGHSTLEHIQHFPIEGVKIGAAFVRGLRGDERCRAITRSVIRLAQDLHLQTVAEGVEHEEQHAFLRDAGCDFIQGFLFSKPMELADFYAVLSSRSSGQ